MNIYIGGDHTGYELKEKIKAYLAELGLGYKVIDKGAFEYNPDDDYPDFVSAVAKSVAGDEGSFGIILGGTGQGEAMCANRIKKARAMVFYGPHEAVKEVDITGRRSADNFELIKLARTHNNANILSLAMRFVSEDEAKFAIELFLSTKFLGEERHERRIKKLG
jgi:ribose 5-phosphate isomerase B